MLARGRPGRWEVFVLSIATSVRDILHSWAPKGVFLKKKKRKLKKNQTLYGMYLYASTAVSGRLEAGKSPGSCRPVLTQERFTADVEV